MVPASHTGLMFWPTGMGLAIEPMIAMETAPLTVSTMAKELIVCVAPASVRLPPLTTPAFVKLVPPSVHADALVSAVRM